MASNSYKIPSLLVNQMKMPIIGLGTYKLGHANGFETFFNIIDNCLRIGYRVFDTAQVYKNEEDIGNCLHRLLPKYELSREDIFLITKIAPINHGEKCEDSVKKSLEMLKTSYIDLVLVHWPGKKGLKPENSANAEQRKQTWISLEKVYADGLVKSIGVSNYTIRHLNELFDHALVKPHLLQAEFHPFLFQHELVKFCAEHSMAFQAYSSLGTSDASASDQLKQDKLIVELANKYSKTPAQILLKWAVQQNIGVIPKSSNIVHLEENFQIFDFEIENTDMMRIETLNRDVHLCWNPAKVY